MMNLTVFMNNWRALENGNVLSLTSCPIFSAIKPTLQSIEDYHIMLNPHKFRYKHK